jgi:putative ABC transport system substrate-binding protein
MWCSAVGFIVTLALGLPAAPLAAAAQPAGKVWRIGFLGYSSGSIPEPFREGLRELGYVEGQNIVFESRGPEGHIDRLPELAAELARANVDLIVTMGTPGTRAAKQATTTIPIVMAFSGDAVGLGLIASLAWPGGNITGTTFLNPELHVKRLELLKEVVPGLSRVAFLLRPDNPAPASRQAMEQAAGPLQLELQTVQVLDPNEVERVFSTLTGEGVHAITMHDDWLQETPARQIAIADGAVKHRLVMVGPAQLAKTGALIGYGVNFNDLWQRAAVFVDKILQGAKPADIPVERPMKFELIINLKTAKALGITIPPHLLVWADKVIQ